MDEAEPYYSEEYQVGRFVIRKTKADADWMRFQAGRSATEHRDYILHRARPRFYEAEVRFNEYVILFHLLGFGATEEEALKMAIGQ